VPDDRARTDRISRARRLARDRPDAAELLTFLAALTEYQQSVAERWRAVANASPGARVLRESLDAVWIVSQVPDALSWLERSAPPGLAAAMPGLRRLPGSTWRGRLDDLLSDRNAGSGPHEEAQLFVVEAVLQPVAEQLADIAPVPAGETGTSRCAFCGCHPVVGALREEGQGAKRTLTCALCAREWTYLRVVCTSCGERRFDALPVYTADQFPGARIDTCETCRTYMKTIDVTKDGTAVPIVDDIATVALDLWARERGYHRLRGNVLRA
jgi:FdhE protein